MSEWYAVLASFKGAVVVCIIPRTIHKCVLSMIVLLLGLKAIDNICTKTATSLLSGNFNLPFKAADLDEPSSKRAWPLQELHQGMTLSGGPEVHLVSSPPTIKPFFDAINVHVRY